jgi:diguanylate cyclase (GGDEF)-like protein
MNLVPAEEPLRAAVEEVCTQLCEVAAGNLDVRLDVSSPDITAQKLSMLGNAVLHVARQALDAVQNSKRELAAAQEMARLGTWRMEVTAGVQRVIWSPELHRLLGTDPDGHLPGDARSWVVVHPGDRARVQAAHQRALAGAVEAYEWRALCPDGVERRIWTDVHPEEHGHAVVGLRAVCQDVTERRRAEDRIRHLAEHDGLTGLVNRAVLLERLGAVLLHRRRRRGGSVQIAVLCLDLDGFKGINDQYGHAAGDRVLVQAAQRMVGLVRGGDTVARLGGDEFAIIQTAREQPAAAERLAARVVAALAQPYDLDNGVEAATVSVSIGVAVAPGDAEHVDGLMAAADQALYRAKASGRNGTAFYTLEMERQARERRALERDLRQAVVRGELSIAYQPLVAVRNGDVLGYEALLRWHHPEHGVVPPDHFIPVAEASGTILPIGKWVLEQACAEAAAWDRPMFVAVNVSPVQVQRGAAFAQMVEDVLARTGLAAGRLELEVTEGVLIRDVDAALDALTRVRALGVRISLDDFGTGYSSLATLQAFPFDKIKVDRRFIARLGDGSAQAAMIVRAVLGLARSLGVPAVAEGVETELQLEVLRGEACAEAQGWLFGRPGPAPARTAGRVLAASA